MAIVTVEQLKEQISWSDDLGSADDELMQRKIDGAQDHIERLLGFNIVEKYSTAVPASLVEAVSQLAASWFENREATLVGVGAEELPFGVWPVINEYREFNFDE